MLRIQRRIRRSPGEACLRSNAVDEALTPMARDEIMPSPASGSVMARVERARSRDRGLFDRLEERFLARFASPLDRRLQRGRHARCPIGQVFGGVLQLPAGLTAGLRG